MSSILLFSKKKENAELSINHDFDTLYTHTHRHKRKHSHACRHETIDYLLWTIWMLTAPTYMRNVASFITFLSSLRCRRRRRNFKSGHNTLSASQTRDCFNPKRSHKMCTHSHSFTHTHTCELLCLCRCLSTERPDKQILGKIIDLALQHYGFFFLFSENEMSSVFNAQCF